MKMIKTITLFETSDGQRWEDAEDALFHEARQELCEELGNLPENIRRSNFDLASWIIERFERKES